MATVAEFDCSRTFLRQCAQAYRRRRAGVDHKSRRRRRRRDWRSTKQTRRRVGPTRRYTTNPQQIEVMEFALIIVAENDIDGNVENLSPISATMQSVASVDEALVGFVV